MRTRFPRKRLACSMVSLSRKRIPFTGGPAEFWTTLDAPCLQALRENAEYFS
jgi:hypothetical protein